MRRSDSLDPVHYVYVHRRASDNGIFYVGKGKGRRAWSLDRKNRHWNNVARKHGLCVDVVKSDMPEPCALAWERIIIRIVGRENLTNLTDGGEGATGYIPPPETRAKMSAAASARKRAPHSAETRAKIAAAHRGMKASPQSIAKMKAASRPRGKENPSYDRTVRKFIHEDGRVFSGTRAEFRAAFNVNDSCASNLIKGKRRTAKGWKIKC